MQKNVAGQKIGCQMVSATDGSNFTGSVTVYVTGDAGTQSAGSVGAGACTHEGKGYHTYAPAQAETNYDLIAFTFEGTGAVTATVQVETRCDANLTHSAGTAITSSGGRPEVNTTHAAGTAWNSGAIGESTLASDTITAAKIAADAITDAKVASDVTIASVTGAVGSVTGAVGSVTGNVGGNVTGSVGSIATGGITTASFAAGAIDAAAIAANAIGASELAADAVAEIQSGLATATAVFTLQTDVTTLTGYVDTEVAAIKAKTDNLPTDPADASDIAAAFSTVNSTLATIAAYIDTEVAAIKAKTDNLPADPADASDIAASFTSIASTLTTIAAYIDTEVAAIKAKTDNLPAAPAATGDIPTAAQNAAALLDLSNGVETGLTPRQALRLIAAALAGKLSGAATATNTIRNAVADSKDRIAATVDADGNRTAITYDLT